MTKFSFSMKFWCLSVVIYIITNGKLRFLILYIGYWLLPLVD